MRTYITTTIPYVNGRPRIGHALEYVQADVLARHRRARGDLVRLQAGTDDNSLKNVLAAQAAGQDIREFIDQNSSLFLSLGPALSLSVDDVIGTSTDPRHRPGVEALWRACAQDLYRNRYEGLYCTGCEQFYAPGERCLEHPGIPLEHVAEENWFFRLSRYGDQLRDAITDGRLRIERAGRRHEVLSLVDAGLADFSVSRSAARAHGWGIPVPGDPAQVIYVWWDALGNYITALGYGSDQDQYQRWWAGGACTFRSASGVVWQIAHQANGFINQVRPWALAGDPGAAARLDAVLGTLYRTCQVLAAELAPFLPDAAARIAAQLTPAGAGRAAASC